MADNIDADLGSKSDEELHALEQDRSLPIDQWMAVEAERGRREKGRQQGATPAASAVVRRCWRWTIAHWCGAGGFRSFLVPGERLTAYAVQRRLFALMHRRTIVGATTGRSSRCSADSSEGTPRTMCGGRISATSQSAPAFSARTSLSRRCRATTWVHRSVRPHAPRFADCGSTKRTGLHDLSGAGAELAREAARTRPRRTPGAVRRNSNRRATGRVAGAAPSVAGDPGERLRRAKEMLDEGLISDTEYDSIKARVVDSL